MLLAAASVFLLLALVFGPARAGAASYVFDSEFGVPGSGTGELNQPAGLAIFNYEGEDFLYVVDSGNDRVQIFDSSGEAVYEFGSQGTGEGQFNSPSGIALGPQTTVYLADTGNNRVQHLDGSGGFLSEIGPASGGGSVLGGPAGIALDSQGDLLVTEALGNEVSRFSASGEFISSFAGGLSRPLGIAVDADDNLLVADSAGNRVVRFTSAGSLLSVIGAAGTGPGLFDLPFGLAVSPGGGLFVSDLNNMCIQQFASDGAFGSSFGSFGLSGAQSGRPGWMTFGTDGTLYVSDFVRSVIQRYRFRYELNAVRAGSGTGSVSAAGTALDCGGVCETSIEPGRTVTLSATPAPGSTFAGWSGAGCSGSATCELSMDQDRSVTANFSLDRRLSVARAGNGAGTVISSPPGIACGATCELIVTEGSPVSLSASPAAGSRFAGWQGSCTGGSECVVAMDADREVTASFVRLPAPRVKVSSKPPRLTRSRSATVRFRSTVASSRFTCRLDRSRFRPCRSPKSYRRLRPGRHRISIRAIAAGVRGPVTSVAWTVRR